MNFDKILNSKFGLFVTGFVLTGLIGFFLRNKQKALLMKRSYWQEKVYAMQKVFWTLENSQSDIADQWWNEYYKIKDEWNIMVGGYRSEIKVFLNPTFVYQTSAKPALLIILTSLVSLLK